MTLLTVLSVTWTEQAEHVEPVHLAKYEAYWTLSCNS